MLHIWVVLFFHKLTTNIGDRYCYAHLPFAAGARGARSASRSARTATVAIIGEFTGELRDY